MTLSLAVTLPLRAALHGTLSGGGLEETEHFLGNCFSILSHLKLELTFICQMCTSPYIVGAHKVKVRWIKVLKILLLEAGHLVTSKSYIHTENSLLKRLVCEST